MADVSTSGDMTYRDAVAEGIAREMRRDPSVVCLGEDIGAAGGVFKTTVGLFEEFGAHKVYGRIPATNEAAKKAVIYNGWKQEGVLRKQVRHGEELIDVELWGGFREDLPEPPEE